MAKLMVEVDASLKRKVEFAAVARDESVKEFLERAIIRELENGDSEDELYIPPKGVKPTGSANPIKPKGGGNPVSDAVIEDRR